MKKFFAKIMSVIMFVLFGFGMFSALKPTTEEASATEQSTGKAIDIYLIAGQSNAVGSSIIDGGMGYPGSNNAALAETYENVWYSGRAHYTTSGSGAYQIPLAAHEYVTQGHGYTRKHMGPEYGMAQYLNTKYENSDRDCAIIKSAAGGTQLLGHHTTVQDNKFEYVEGKEYTNHERFGSWYPESLWNVKGKNDEKLDLWQADNYLFKTGLQYRAFIDWVDVEVQYLKEQGYTDIKFKALCWMQGESDRGQIEQYREVFNIFCSDVRSTISERTGINCLDMPVVVGEISDTFGAYSSMDLNLAFNNMLNDIQTEIPNIYTINTGDYWINGPTGVLGSDSAHWSYSDMVEIGRLFGETAYKAVASAKRLYVDKFSHSTVLYTTPSGLFVPSAYILEGEENVTLNFTTDIQYKVEDFGFKKGDELVSYDGEFSYEIVDGKREYAYVMDVPEEGNLEMYVTYGNANKVKATCQVKDGDTTFGNNVSSALMYNNGEAYEDGSFYFSASPKDNGRLKSAWINGIEVADVMGLSRIEIDDVSDYMQNGETSLAIVVEYEQCDVLTIENPKLTYIVGEEISTADSTVILTMPDGSTKELALSEYEIDDSKYNKLLPGNYEVKINRLGAKSITLMVEVIISPLFVQGIEPAYILGTTFDESNLVVQYQTVTGEKITLPANEYTVTTNFNKDAKGTYTVTITPDSKYPYPAKTISVKVVEPVTLSITGQTMSFNIGEDFELGNMTVKATGASGTTTLSTDDFTVDYSAFNKDVVGEYDVVVSTYGADDYIYTVTVIQPTITVSEMVDKYNVGNAFSKKGIKVIYEDKFGSIELRSSEYTVDSSEFNKDVAGEYTITITVKDDVYITNEDKAVVVSATYTATVIQPSITLSGYNTEMLRNSTFSAGDLVVTYTDKNGEKTLTESEYLVDSTAVNSSVAGTYTVTVTAKNIVATYDITVNNAFVVTFSANGAVYSDAQIVAEGGKAVKPAVDPTKSADAQNTYAFVGWYNGDTAWNFDTVVTSDLNLTAKFDATPISGGNEGGNDNASGGGCSGKAGEIMLLVSSLCALAFVGRKVGKA